MSTESEEPYRGSAWWLSVDYPDGRSVFYRLNDVGDLFWRRDGSIVPFSMKSVNNAQPGSVGSSNLERPNSPGVPDARRTVWPEKMGPGQFPGRSACFLLIDLTDLSQSAARYSQSQKPTVVRSSDVPRVGDTIPIATRANGSAGTTELDPAKVDRMH
jgi:hypothetical protein